MKLPLQISFHNMPPSEAVEAMIRDHAANLDEFAGDIMSCRVIVDMPHRHHRTGNLYQVRIDMTVRDGEIAVTSLPEGRDDYQDIRIAVRDAFDAAVRQLEDHVRRVRKAVKTHQPVPFARVSRLFSEAGYGFVQTPDGRELYFHRHSVLPPGFERLELGTEVTFDEELGEKGPQATTVRIAGRHHSA